MSETNDKDYKLIVFDTIKNDRIQKYMDEVQELTKNGLSFFGYFNGENTLTIESLNNLNLKIKKLQKMRNRL